MSSFCHLYLRFWYVWQWPNRHSSISWVSISAIFDFKAVYNSILFSSPYLVLLSNLNLCSFWSPRCPHIKSVNQGMPVFGFRASSHKKNLELYLEHMQHTDKLFLVNCENFSFWQGKCDKFGQTLYILKLCCLNTMNM